MAEFHTVLEVLAYLQDAGWRVSKSTLYNHVRDGLLRRNGSGVFNQGAVDKYARLHLPKADTGQKVADELEELQREKYLAELRKLKAEAERKQFDLEVLRGKYIPRDTFEQELAARAVLLNSGLRQFFQVMVSDFISMVGGDPNKAPEMLEWCNARLDELFNDYARTDEFQVMLESDTDVS